MVTFSYLNLSEDIYPSPFNNTNAMDVIFCRNVLMYFTPDHAKQVVQRLYSSLTDGGSFIVSPVETSHVLHSRFETIKFPGAMLYRKESEKYREAKASESKVSRTETLTSIYPGYKQPVVISPKQTVPRREIIKQLLDAESEKQKNPGGNERPMKKH